MSVGWGQWCTNEEEIEIDSIEDICNLIDLTEIDLSESNLTGEIPSCIGNLTNLTCLDLGYNELACPPKVVPSVKLVFVQTERNKEYDT